MTESLHSNVRILLPEQENELLALHVRVPDRSSPREALQHIISAIAEIMGSRAALVCKEDGAWSVAVQAGEGPAIPPVAEVAQAALNRVGDAPGVVIECWNLNHESWTLVGLTRRSAMSAVLMLNHDWELSADTLRRLGESLLLAERAYALSSSAQVRVATHRLTRALSRSSGFAGVAEAAVRNAARAVRAQLATLAVADAEHRVLRIMATHGYPLALVEHLRIERGNGVMGSVYESGLPLRVKDIAVYQGARKRRSRYRTDSFAVVPIMAGPEVLGVLSVTDRADGQAFTQGDLSTLRTLAAPLALALGRERALAQAGSYAQAAAIDPVSGLFNRRYFHARLDEELQRAHRHKLSVGLLMIDVDDFKLVNDRYGHLVGDAVIRAFSDILRRSVRAFDICARFGGEEFAVVMPGSGAEDAGHIAERIRQRVENYTPDEPHLAALRITVSIGFSVSRPDTSPRDLINNADMALYQAKRKGKNQVREEVVPGAVALESKLGPTKPA